MTKDTKHSFSPDSQFVYFEQDGQKKKSHYTFYRGENTNFYPTDETFTRDDVVQECLVKGMMPPAPFITPETSIVAFGSCFASHISTYLAGMKFGIETKKNLKPYISQMGDGIVNTYSILQQFEWAWENKVPQNVLWHGYDAKAFGYDDDVRLSTKSMMDGADVFIITYGLSEIWYDEPTGEVFWRAVPHENFDPARHKFRVSTHAENLENIKKIHAIIRRHRPSATIIQTVSPIALTATFRPVSCITADSVSKAIIRAAVDEFQRGHLDANTFYFPSYEIVLNSFKHHLMEDRKHVHKHVLDFNMKVFERYFCKTGMTDSDLLAAFRQTQAMDDTVGREGPWSVPRINLLHSFPPGYVPPPKKPPQVFTFKNGVPVKT